jgi:hypothetical protein
MSKNYLTFNLVSSATGNDSPPYAFDKLSLITRGLLESMGLSNYIFTTRKSKEWIG